MDVSRILRKGSKGRLVRFLQIVLNRRFDPKSKLLAEGIFGFRTEAATKKFQVKHDLTVDGVVGPRTWAALKAPATHPYCSDLHVTKFIARLGAVDGFVRHVRDLEGQTSSKSELFDQLSDFSVTSRRTRYLIVQRQRVGVIDFRHFFAAASEAYAGALSDGAFGPPSRRRTLLLGVRNEVFQCGSELKRALHIGDAAKIDSCFSREDLGSNRLGAEFGCLIVITGAEDSRRSVHQQLRRYLNGLRPLSPHDTEKIKMPSNTRVLLEVLAATVLGPYDLLVPDAY